MNTKTNIFAFLLMFLAISAFSGRLLTIEEQQEVSDIMAKLAANGLVSQEKITFQGIIPDHGQSTRFLILIDDGTKKMVAKVFKDEESYNRESEKIDQINQLRAKSIELQKASGKEIPILVEIFGHMALPNSGVLLMERAEGTSMNSLLFDMYQMNEDQIQDIFYSIGQQQGNLDVLFYKDQGKLLFHEDLHAENIFIDRNNRKSYWIDLDTLELADMVPNFSTADYFTRVMFEAATDTEGRFGKKGDYYERIIKMINNKEKLIEVTTRIKKSFAAYVSLKLGYLSALKHEKDPLLLESFKKEAGDLKTGVQNLLNKINSEIRAKTAEWCDLCIVTPKLSE